VRESWLVVVERCMGWRAVGVGGVEERKVDLQLRPPNDDVLRCQAISPDLDHVQTSKHPT
jgi:hypothetical protein